MAVQLQEIKMSEMNPIEREQKKKQLRGRVIDTARRTCFPAGA